MGLLDTLLDPEFWRAANNRAEGLLGQPVTGLNQFAGLLSGALPPGQFAQIRGQQAVQALQPTPSNALNFMSPGIGGATVYHGSPYKFDAFDASKIGTGEGAQAYGHGLYFADNPGVARSYSSMDHPALGADPRDEVTALRQNWQMGPNPRNLSEDEVRSLMQDFPTLAPHRDNPDIVRNIARATNGAEPGGTVSPEAIYAFRALDKQLPPKPVGSTYKVDIPDESIGKMLHWDLPLSQQPANVQKALLANEDLGSGITYRDWPGSSYEPPSGATNFSNGVTGADAWQELQKAWGPQKASEMLRQAGIPGIKYLDGGSRGAGQGTHNYVLFDPAQVKILGRE